MSKKVIEGDVDLSSIWLEELPEFLAVDELRGNFRIDQYRYPQLRSLNNLPALVNGTVVVNYTKIKDLEGSPEIILNNFEIDSNTNLTSLRGAPKYIAGIFSIQFSESLSSLDHGWPEKVKVGRGVHIFYCGENKFTEEDVLKYYDVAPQDIFITDLPPYDEYDLEADLDERDYFNDR